MENFNIQSIIKFSKRVFEDPLVPTCAKFLSPLAKSIKHTKTIYFNKEDTDFLVLDINDYIVSKIKKAKLQQLKGIKKLYEDGYRGLYQYTIHSMWEKEVWGRYGSPHKRVSVKSNRSNHCWFNLGELTIPDLMIPETCWERIFVISNIDDLVADRNLLTYIFQINLIRNLLEVCLIQIYLNFLEKLMEGLQNYRFLSRIKNCIYFRVVLWKKE